MINFLKVIRSLPSFSTEFILGVIIAGIVIFAVSGAIVFFRSSVTIYHLPLIMLVLLTITSGLAVTVGASQIQADGDKISYTVESTSQEYEISNTEWTYEYSKLSPEAQEVFRSALESDDEYSTRLSPDEFRLMTDTGRNENYIKYNSEYYVLTGSSRGGLGSMFAFLGIVFIGGSATIGLFSASVISYRRNSFILPATVLSGFSSTVGLIVIGVRPVEILTVTIVLIPILTWVGLRAYERHSHKSFAERMNSQN